MQGENEKKNTYKFESHKDATLQFMSMTGIKVQGWHQKKDYKQQHLISNYFGGNFFFRVHTDICYTAIGQLRNVSSQTRQSD